MSALTFLLFKVTRNFLGDDFFLMVTCFFLGLSFLPALMLLFLQWVFVLVAVAVSQEAAASSASISAAARRACCFAAALKDMVALEPSRSIF